MSFVYVTTYLRQIDHIAQSTALDINTISMAVLLLLLAPVGSLSDRCGRKPVLLVATGGTLLMAWPLFWMLHHNVPFVILFGQIGFAVLSACFWSTIPATMVELVPERVRCTVLSLGYNTRNGDPWRADANGRRLHDRAKPVRPFAGLPADDRGCGFPSLGRLSGRDLQDVIAGHCCGAC
jgi:hypothetical protein